MGDQPAREALLAWLKRSARNEEFQFGCIRGLALVADTPARTALAKLLRETSSKAARWQCLRECEQLFGPEIERSLLELFNNLEQIDQQEDLETQIECARVLGRIGSPAVAEQFLKLLSAPLEMLVKRAMCEAIAETGNDQGRERLRALAMQTDGEPELSFLAALALIRVGDEKLLPNLLLACASPRCPVEWRRLATQACQECSSELARDFLVQRLLEDPSVKLKEAAVNGLVRFGGPQVMDALRRARRTSSNDELDFRCLCALASVGDAAASQELIASLKVPQQKQARRFATVEVLGLIERDEARRTLQRLFEDTTEAEPVRSRCRDMLRSIQRQQGWRALHHGEWEAP